MSISIQNSTRLKGNVLLRMHDFLQVIAANVTGAFFSINRRAFLPVLGDLVPDKL